MSILDKFLDAIRLNDDYDEEEDFKDEPADPKQEEPEESPRKKRRFFKKIEEPEDVMDEVTTTPKRASSFRLKTESQNYEAPKPAPKTISRPAPKPTPVSKVTPVRRQGTSGNMEVCVIKPSTMEDTKDIVDTLLDRCTVVLNLEGIDVEVAQRIIDFSCGACYSINGSLQKVSSYIYILTPANVSISGDITDLLNGMVPSIRTEF